MPLRLLIALLWLGAVAGGAAAQDAETSLPSFFTELDRVKQLPLPAFDLHRELLEDEKRASRGRVAHFAAALEVDADPWRFGSWEALEQGRARWLLRVSSPGALSLSLAFTEIYLPEGARLNVLSPEGAVLAGPFTEADNDEHRQLWTPPLVGDDLVIALDLDLDRLDRLDLSLTRVHHGHAGFGRPSAEKSGACQVDLVCAPNEDWHELGKAVGLVSVMGVRYCSGFLVNNTAQDGRPFFVTAGHCGIDAITAPSVVVMWEHAVSECDPGAEAPLPSRSFQTGAYLRASHRSSDLVLIELDDAPNTGDGALFAGWDRSFDEPQRVVTIHHPNTDRRRVAYSDAPARTTDHLGDRARARGDHLRVASWTAGTTEGGSSGAPLFNEDLRVVGALHGGHAACGNREADWFGRLSAAWDDGASPAHRFRDWLDPLGTGAVVLDALVP